MKKIYQLFLIVELIVLHSSLANAEQVTHTVTYEPAKLSFHLDTASNNNIYTVVEYDGLHTYNRVSSPKIPADLLTFSVPYNATNFSVQLSVNSYVQYDINFQVYPVQESYPLDNELVHEFTEPDPVEYSSYDFIPKVNSKILASGNLYGDNQVVTVSISPITYNPVYRLIRLATNLTVTLNYDVDTLKVPLLARYNINVKEREIANIKEFIANGFYMDMNSYIFSQPNPSSSYCEIESDLPTYTYCIVTNRELEPAFKKIVAMKRHKGLSAGVICVEDLMASQEFGGGDINFDNNGYQYPIIADSAGVVRQYLKYAFQSSTTPTQYVLFGGKAPYAPVRYTNSLNTNDNFHQRHIATDLYFSDLKMPWVHNNSPYDNQQQSEYIIPGMGSNNNPLPYYPDLFVGRLLCSNKEEVNNYSDKLYNYMFNPGDGDNSYLQNALIVSSNAIKEQADNFEGFVGNCFDNLTHIRNSITNHYTGSQIISNINQNRYGYISFYGHGEPQSIEIFDNGSYKNIVSALDNTVSLPYTIDEDNNGLDCLSNKHHPFICYSISCTTMPYDIDTTFIYLTQFNNKYNFGESITLGKSYGGPAYLGNTRMGYSTVSEVVEAEFVSSVYNKNITSLGKAEAFSKVFYKPSNQIGYNSIVLGHNLLGDPEFEMWTHVPQQYSEITCSRSISGFLIYGVSSNDTIAFCDNAGNVGRRYGNNGFVSLLGISPNSSIMIYNNEHIPLFLPLILQKCDISNSQYVYTSSFAAGRISARSLIYFASFFGSLSWVFIALIRSFAAGAIPFSHRRNLKPNQ